MIPTLFATMTKKGKGYYLLTPNDNLSFVGRASRNANHKQKACLGRALGSQINLHQETTGCLYLSKSQALEH